jgi:methanogenic corrinoid protein MtbC1
MNDTATLVGLEGADEYLAALLDGDKRHAVAAVFDRLDDGWTVPRIYLEILEPAQRRLGDLWQVNRISVAQEHFASAVTQLVMCQLYAVGSAEAPRRGLRAVACAAGGELHEIGLRMVADFLDMAGWDSYQVGGNTPVGSICAAAIERAAHLVALSATMSDNVPVLAEAITALRADPRSADIPIIVGGAAFRSDPGLAEEMGADGYAPDATTAVELAERLAVRAQGG